MKYKKIWFELSHKLSSVGSDMYYMCRVFESSIVPLIHLKDEILVTRLFGKKKMV